MTEKRLGRLVMCPVCYSQVNPIVIAEYPQNEKGAIPIPARTVLQCPIEECRNKSITVWYIPTERIEELPLADTD
jgi:hypothetical protein